MGHNCKYAGVVCIDFRFRAKMAKYLARRFGTDDFDLYSWPGAAKKLADKSTQAQYLDDIAVCANLHAGEKLVIVSHTDCGAYGGSAAFASEQHELDKLSADLREAREAVRNRFANIGVELVIYDSKKDVFLPVT